MRDDRVFLATRLLGATVVPFLVVAFALEWHMLGRRPSVSRMGETGHQTVSNASS